jgi:hypothetical protein
MFIPTSYTIAVFVAIGLVGCSDAAGPAGAPSSPSGLIPSPSAVISSAPTVTGLSVTVGSTAGGTRIKLTGSDLQRGATVTFDTAIVGSPGYDPRDAVNTSLSVLTPAHGAGLVDVTVTNPDRQTFRLSRGYEFVPQESFDFNGDWSGVTSDGADILVDFTIKNNVLVTATCRFDIENKVLGLSTPVINGAFSVMTADGAMLSGRMVSTSQSVGQMTAPQCLGNTHPWSASKY